LRERERGERAGGKETGENCPRKIPPMLPVNG